MHLNGATFINQLQENHMAKQIATPIHDIEYYMHKDSISEFRNYKNATGSKIENLSHVQFIVEYYKFVKEYAEVPNWNGKYYRRFSGASKRILKWADEDVYKATEIIWYISFYLDKKGLIWTLETIYRFIPEYYYKYQDDRSHHLIGYRGE